MIAPGDQRIPIAAAKAIADQYECAQVILVAWDGEQTHVITYGDTIEDCDQAAMGGNFVKKAMGWPKHLWHTRPARVTRLEKKLVELEAEILDLKSTNNRLT